MRAFLALVLVLATAVASGCGSESPSPDAATDAKPDSFRDAPDFGGVKEVEVDATGIGASREEASLRALDSAIAQVNGRRVSSASVVATKSLTIDVDGLRALDAQSSAFAELLASSSDGAVTSFQVISAEAVTKLEVEREYKGSQASGGWIEDAWGSVGGYQESEYEGKEKIYENYWKVKVRARIAQFSAPAEDGRPKLLIAAPRQAVDSYPVGDEVVPADAVGEAVKRRIAQSLSQSGRFVMLDRDLAPELQREVAFINSGNARLADIARLGQQLATDLILVPTIERFEYRRHVRTLRMSDRELVSYTGGGDVNLDVVNATTGEVILSRRFEYTLPPTDPSTLPRVIDGAAMADLMMDALSGEMAKSVLSSIFPISVVALQGDVAVLSQGGQSFVVGESYQVVRMGEPVTDPQTGRSLGRIELPCCTLTVDRVSAQTAYGRLTGDVPAAEAFKPGMLELREEVVVATAALVPVPGKTNAPTTQRATPTPATATPRDAPPQNDENW